jgi:Siphovirus Gp157
MATQLVPRPQSCTLYDLEDTLQAWVNTIALAEEPAARQAILDEIGQALKKTKEKRDAVVAFLHHCEQQQKFADAEIERLQKRKEMITRVHGGLECYLVRVIDQFAAPDRRGVKRLEGNFSSMRIQKNPDSVAITDEQALPAAWKDVVLTMAAHAWEALLQRLDPEDRAVFERQVKKREFKPDKRAIAGELKTGTEIPGADLTFGEFRLVID